MHVIKFIWILKMPLLVIMAYAFIKLYYIFFGGKIQIFNISFMIFLIDC